MNSEGINVVYKGMKCRLYKSYISEDYGPLVMIVSSKDINKAYELGFECIGYPTEIAKIISENEYNILSTKGYL